MAKRPHKQHDAGDEFPRRFCATSLGFFKDRHIRRILTLSGLRPQWAWPRPTRDAIGVWGHAPRAWRGEKLALKTGADLIRIEDAFLRSVLPGRMGSSPLGLTINRMGCAFDANCITDLENILTTHPLNDPDLLAQAISARARIAKHHISKYNMIDPAAPLPQEDYVLIIDQTRSDASVQMGNATAQDFHRMLADAKRDHPDAKIVIKTHPETTQGTRAGHFGNEDLDARVSIYDGPASPYALCAQARAVYAVTSQFGFESILAGKTPKIYGQPFYAGWGLTTDIRPIDRRTRTLTPNQLFAGAMILYPTWYDPFEDKLCDIHRVIDILIAESKSWREDHQGWHALGMRLWKRRPLQKIFGNYRPVRFGKSPAIKGPTMAWGRGDAPSVSRLEDGFLRSIGLGASLTPPMSLILDHSGIYFDPTRPSDLEALITASVQLEQHDVNRAQTLRQQITAKGISKYNLAGNPVTRPAGHCILVPGQVEDDASIQFGTDGISTNLDLLLETRRQNPDAHIMYKPHPDVVAGLRNGHVPDALDHADTVLKDVDITSAIDACDAVWTMTSLTGFEALMRGKEVVCLGMPFYAGWGLTRDALRCPRRQAKPTIDQLVHAALIDYPRYFDPVSGQICPVEVVVDRLANGQIGRRGLGNRLISKIQGSLASYAHLWR